MVNSIRYYDNDGLLLEEYLENPVVLGPLASTDFLVEYRDEAGGAGANFLVDWAAETAVTEPLIEAVMVRVGGNQAFAFRSPGTPISRLGEEEPLNYPIACRSDRSRSSTRCDDNRRKLKAGPLG